MLILIKSIDRPDTNTNTTSVLVLATSPTVPKN